MSQPEKLFNGHCMLNKSEAEGEVLGRSVSYFRIEKMSGAAIRGRKFQSRI